MQDHLKNQTIKAVFLIIGVVAIVLLIGFVGYRYFFNLSVVDAFYNTSLTASTLGVEVRERSNAEKIFTSFYALLVGVFFISTISMIISYLFAMHYIEKNKMMPL